MKVENIVCCIFLQCYSYGTTNNIQHLAYFYKNFDKIWHRGALLFSFKIQKLAQFIDTQQVWFWSCLQVTETLFVCYKQPQNPSRGVDESTREHIKEIERHSVSNKHYG